MRNDIVLLNSCVLYVTKLQEAEIADGKLLHGGSTEQEVAKFGISADHLVFL